jgi:site-specific recombinase XerC
MPIKPERARALLPRVDPARLRAGRPVGLRDSAVLALLSAGLSAEEIVALRASAVTRHRDKLWVKLRRYGNTWFLVLSPDLRGHLQVWLSDRGLWDSSELLFAGPEGPLTPTGIYMILSRHEPKGKQ